MATGTAPAFTVTLNAAQVTLFSVDEAAFDRWCAAKGDELECEVPKWTDPSAGAALSDLFHDAQKAGVIKGTPASNFRSTVTTTPKSVASMPYSRTPSAINASSGSPAAGPRFLL